MPEKPCKSLSLTRRDAILSGAREVFFAHGFESASMDLVAEAAGVVKKTLYNYFAGKEALFEAVIVSICEEIGAELDHAGESDDIETTLVRFGRWIALMTPAEVEVYRSAIAHARRFPKFGRMLRQASDAKVEADLAAYLERQAAAGRLVLDDPHQAAHLLMGAMAYPLLRTLLDDKARLRQRDAEQHLRGAVRMFLRAHRTS